MIRHSRPMIAACLVAAVAAHAGGAWLGTAADRARIAGGSGAPQAALGSSFADMVKGAAQPVSNSAVTPNRTADRTHAPADPPPAVQPRRPDAVAKPAGPATASRRAATSHAVAPSTQAAAPTTPADPTANTAPVTDRPAPSSAPTTAPPAQRAVRATPEDVIAPAPKAREGLQVSRRPQVRPAQVEQAARDTRAARARTTRQARAPEPQKQQSRGSSGSNAERSAKQGSAVGAETATAARAGTRTDRTSRADGNAAASNYPGKVMARLSRVPRPRLDSRGAAVVRFSIAGNGGLAGVGLARSSGSTRLDRAAVRVVRRAAPFPRPPRGAQRSFSVRIKAN
jgi:protein TonB